MDRISRVLAAGVAAAFWACGDTETAPAGGSPEATAPPAPAPAPAPVETSAAEQADQIFATRCYTCHGPEGPVTDPVRRA